MTEPWTGLQGLDHNVHSLYVSGTCRWTLDSRANRMKCCDYELKWQLDEDRITFIVFYEYKCWGLWTAALISNRLSVSRSAFVNFDTLTWADVAVLIFSGAAEVEQTIEALNLCRITLLHGSQQYKHIWVITWADNEQIVVSPWQMSVPCCFSSLLVPISFPFIPFLEGNSFFTSASCGLHDVFLKQAPKEDLWPEEEAGFSLRYIAATSGSGLLEAHKENITTLEIFMQIHAKAT